MPLRPVALVLGGLLVLALPDLAQRLEALDLRLEHLEERVARLESANPPPQPAAPLDDDALRARRLEQLGARMGLTPEELAGLGPSERAWTVRVREAALQAWLIATQVAGNEGLLRPDERMAMAEEAHRWAAGRSLASAVAADASPGLAWTALEEGVRELLEGWLRRAGRPVTPERLAGLLDAWRGLSVVIVREPLDRGARERAELLPR